MAGKLTLDPSGHADSNDDGGELSCAVVASDRAPEPVSLQQLVGNENGQFCT